MGAAVALWDVVGEGQDVLMVAVIPPHRDFNSDAIFFSTHCDRRVNQRAFVFI